MKKQIGKLLQRITVSPKSPAERRQQLQLEALEGRRLLAGDVYPVPFPYQNDLIHEDVSGDYVVSPIDALHVVNAINDGQAGKLPDVEPGRKTDGLLLDVSGDNYLTPLDALMVQNFLNGEGETTPTAVFTHRFVDTSGTPLSTNQVAVGEMFQLQTFVRDTRGFSAAGINAAYLDIDYDNIDAFDVAVGEIQTLKFFIDKLSAIDTSSYFTLSFQGQTTNPIGLFDNNGTPNDPSDDAPRSDATLADIMDAELQALSSIGAGNVSVSVDSAAKSQDLANGIPRFNFEIRFLNDLSRQDLPMITLDPTNVAVNPGETFVFEIAESLAGDSQTPEAQGRAFIFNEIYDLARAPKAGQINVTDQGFDDVGATSLLVPLPAPGQAKLLFTVPMIATAPGVINFTPNEADNSPTTDIVTGTTVIPVSMVDYGDIFSLTVISDPTAPVANNDSVSISEDNPLVLGSNILSNDVVESGRTLSIDSLALTGTSVGTLNGSTYTPPQDFVGTDTLTYVAIDSTGLLSNTATVTITITAVNDPPIANNDAFNVDEDSTGNSLDVLNNDTGGPANEAGDTIVVNSIGALNNGGTAVIGPNGSSIIYTPAAGFIGEETFTYTIRDQAGAISQAAQVTVSVEPGVVPRARPDQATTAENTPVNVDVLANDTVNPNADAILISVSNGSFGTVVIDDNGTPADQTDDTVTYTPTDPDFNGRDTFTYVMNDTAELGEDSIGTVTITVTDVNDPPTANDDTVEGVEDTELVIPFATLLANDTPGPGEGAGSQNPQSLTITSVSGQGVTIQGTNVVYNPAKDFNGTFEFTYTIQDSGTPALTDTANVTVNVAAVNDPPVAGDDTAGTDEDTALAIPVATLLANDSPGPADESGQVLSIVSVSSSSSAGGTVSLSNGTVTYTPAPNYFGTDTFTYQLSDSIATAQGTVTVTVAPINDAPVAVADSVTGFSDRALVIDIADLLANDSSGPANEANQTLSIVGVTPTGETNGTVVINGDTIVYTPAAGFSGQASFEYTLQDSGPSGGKNVNQATGKVNVTVEEFRPSSISGIAWVDETNDGEIDTRERRLGSAIVTLTGVSMGETITPQSEMTLADGSFIFSDLAPGSYVVTFTPPYFMIDSDLPNSYSIEITEPGGVDIGDTNFAVLGLDRGIAGIVDQLASSYFARNPSMMNMGYYFGVGADNSLLWSAKLGGFNATEFAEAVLTKNGTELLLTYVDASANVFTASLDRTQFIRVTDAAGNAVIRILGDGSGFNWQQIDRVSPAFTAEKYLDSVDAIFAQEGWDD